MHQENDSMQDRSNQIWVFRAFAILSVCCAHMPPTEMTQSIDAWCGRILAMYGTLGVGGFFLCSGYFFDRQKAVTLNYWKNKIQKLIIPWIVLGTLVKMWYLHIMNMDFRWTEYLTWMIGKGTWLYFIPVLVELLVIFTFVGNRLPILLILGACSVISNIAVMRGYGYQSFVTPDMNPLNWAMFFLLGMLWKRQEGIVNTFLNKWKYVIYVFLAVWSVLYFGAECSVTYWNLYAIPFELAGIFVLMKIAYVFRNSRALQTIGRNTLFIYISHMIMAGWVMNHMLSTGIILLLRPIVTILILYVEIEIVTRGCRWLHLEKILPYIGMSINRGETRG